DDIMIYTKTEKPIDAETTLQPAIDEAYKWGRKWKFKFAPDKSGMITFTRAYKPGDDPLLFLNGHRIQPKKSAKFLGVTFDYKLLWKEQIEQVIAKCMRVKNLLKVLTNTKAGPSTPTLILLFKSLVQSIIDYGLIAYGNTSKTNLEKLDIVHRAIIRIILGSKISTPKEILYAESDTAPIATRRKWLTRKYLINLSTRPRNPMYNTAKELFDDQMEYPTRSTPGLINEMRPMICKTLWFPTTKNKAKANPGAVVERFRTLHQQIPTTTLCIYTDGAKSQTSKTTTCAMYIPTRNVSQSWTMDSQASIYSAELIAVHKALDYTYKLDENPPEVRVFCDSSSVVKAIGSTTPGNNETLHQIRETISSLKSSGTQTSLTWIPSHVGIQGNEVADRLAQTECTKPSGAKANHKLSPSEKISIAKAEWRKDHLLYLKTCRKACIQTMSRTGLTKWFHHKERAITVCLHRLRTGHNYLNSFNHRV
ncbi:Uncharacterized protein APZ42_009289, partial [Daphnia magna]